MSSWQLHSDCVSPLGDESYLVNIHNILVISIVIF